jgi:hypothetical protein
MSARQWQGRKANRNEPGSLEVNQTAAVKGTLGSKPGIKSRLGGLWHVFKAGEYNTVESRRCN